MVIQIRTIIYMFIISMHPQIYFLIWKQSLPSVVVQLEWIVASFRNNSKLQKLQRGESILLKNRNIVAVHWFDKRGVFAMSTIYGTGDVEVT